MNRPEPRTCPYSGLPIRQEPAWQARWVSRQFQFSLEEVGKGIWVLRLQGSPGPNGLPMAMQQAMLLLPSPPDPPEPLALMLDLQGVQESGLATRRNLAALLPELSHLAAWVAYPAAWDIRLLAQWAKSIRQVPYAVSVTWGYAPAMDFALETLTLAGADPRRGATHPWTEAETHACTYPLAQGSLELKLGLDNLLWAAPTGKTTAAEWNQVRPQFLRQNSSSDPQVELWNLTYLASPWEPLLAQSQGRVQGQVIFPLRWWERLELWFRAWFQPRLRRVSSALGPEQARERAQQLLANLEPPSPLGAPNPNWLLDLGEFRIQFRLLPGGVFHSESQGNLLEAMIPPLFERQEEVFQEMGLEGQSYSLVGDVRRLQGSNTKARHAYKEALLVWYERHPFNAYILYGVDSLLRAAVNLARPLVGFKAYVAKDLNEALALAKSAAQPKQAAKAQEPLAQEILQRLSLINWNQPKAVHQPPFSADHPFAEVFTALELVQEEVQELLQEQEESSRRQRRSQARMLKAQELALFGFWELNLDDDHFQLAPNLKAMLGFSEGQEVSLSDFLSRIAAEDRVHFAEAMEKARSNGEAFELSLMVALPDGSKRYLVGTGELEPAEGHGRGSLYGTVQDVTRRSRVELDLQFQLESQMAVSELLGLSYQQHDLQVNLTKALGIILKINLFAEVGRGCIFLYESKTKKLVMEAWQNLDPGLLTACERLSLGECLCGIAALQGSICTLDSNDKRHLQREALQDHGHFFVPLQEGTALIGLLNIYVPARQKLTRLHARVLKSLGQALSSLVLRHRQDEELNNYQTLLEAKVEQKSSALVVSQENYKNLFDKVVQGVLSLANNQIQLANPAMNRLAGLDPKQGQSLVGYDFFSLVAPEDRARVVAALEPHLLGEEVSDIIEFHLQTPFGELKTVQAQLQTSDLVGEQAVVMVQDITEQRALERQREQYQVKLIEAKEKAEEANRMKSQFLANISHELRTPMHGILSFAEKGVTRGDKVAPQKTQHYFDQIFHSGERLMRLVNELLDLSKLEAGKGQYQKKTFALVDLVRTLDQETAFLLDNKNIRTELRCQGESHLEGDPDRILQVLRNLWNNAIRFSPQDGFLQIDIANQTPEGETSTWLQLCLSDQGPGVPTGELETVFDSFVQSSRTKDGSGGTGLGLAISREIIKDHGGQIWAENLAQGGAKFCIRLPRKCRISKSRILKVQSTEEP